MLNFVNQLVDAIHNMLYTNCMMTNKFLKQAIKQSNLTQADVARKMNVTAQAVSGIVATPSPKPETAIRLLLAVGWPLEEIANIRLGDIYEIDAVV